MAQSNNNTILITMMLGSSTRCRGGSAASNGDVASSFSLLLADPNLVLGGIDTDADTTKKRKRSQSMN